MILKKKKYSLFPGNFIVRYLSSFCKVVPGESVAGQHRMVVCKMILETKKRKKLKTELKLNGGS